MKPTDVPRHSVEGQQLLASLRLQEDQRRRRHDELMAKFREQDARISAIKNAEHLAAIEAARTQAAEPAVIPAAYTAEVLPPAETITDAEVFARFRAEHIHTDRGILG
jgi:fructose-1,6-bisphosphatase/sedoheptulose 1,7-bisphosphatase-like protein